MIEDDFLRALHCEIEDAKRERDKLIRLVEQLEGRISGLELAGTHYLAIITIKKTEEEEGGEG